MTTRIKNDTPSQRIRNDVTNTRISAFQTGKTGMPGISVGMPIGLLLALTYSGPATIGSFGDFRPNTRIANT